jgi:hydrogenase nickel incorporation protein HypB
MCETCGCTITPANAHLVQAQGKLERTADGKASVEVLASLLHENDHQAGHNREHFNRHGVLAINLMSAPGSGKTSLLESTIEALGGELSIAVIEGDLETENDAQRIRARGVPAVQITTGQACHLDAHMVHDALHAMNLAGQLRPGPSCECHAAFGDRGRRQAGQVPGHVPGGRPGVAQQGRFP